MRLFVACVLPDDVRDALGGWAEETVGDDRALRLVDPEALHLTLAFLGERPEEDLPALAAALGAVPAAPLRIGRPLWLSPRRPHVLTVEIEDPDGVLREAQAALAVRLREAIGWEPEARGFRPHVTVARVRRGEQVVPRALPEPPQLAFADEGVVLHRSHLGPAGARYEEVARARVA